MHLRPMYSLFLTLSEQSIALRAPAVHGVSSIKNRNRFSATEKLIFFLKKSDPRIIDFPKGNRSSGLEFSKIFACGRQSCNSKSLTISPAAHHENSDHN